MVDQGMVDDRDRLLGLSKGLIPIPQRSRNTVNTGRGI